MTSLGINMINTIKCLEYVTTKYGTAENADVVFGIEILNEPIFWAPNDFGITKTWVAAAYNAITAAATNTNLQIITHDSFMGLQNWYDLGSAINGNLPSSQFAIDVHLYQNQSPDDNNLDVNGHIQEACSWGNTVKSSVLPWYAGEFSAATNVCVNPDGSSFGDNGTQECTVPGCQCTDTVSIDQWSPALKNT